MYLSDSGLVEGQFRRLITFVKVNGNVIAS